MSPFAWELVCFPSCGQAVILLVLVAATIIARHQEHDGCGLYAGFHLRSRNRNVMAAQWERPVLGAEM